MNHEMTPTERLAAKIQGLQAELELSNEALFFEKSETAHLRGQLNAALGSLASILADTEPGLHPSHNARDRAYATARATLKTLNNNDK